MAIKLPNVATLPGPDTIARRVFSNGAIGLAWENYSSPSVVVHGWLWAGSVDVPPEQAGLAGLVSTSLAGILMRNAGRFGCSRR